ncbi:MAG: hypothetical protein UR31_C0017G0009 [Parcubacteria group bacterium GW2011_GWA2_33_14]|uniref:Uncharacterized protein n=1 Tax=Candidatus Staskawiczbacteria bacterium RIFCSPHIGHO2_02_FULL_33_16 TaxID=1802204 RepID=A0A1G2HXY8_9BACT|nr:MAG: hypothetical protein UR31_C0017G0009 [Parcubacteria group bacterium GW2011_GWA2_33_14]OGZ67436.1 MAG: hypothetical protein A3D34_02230 [Candidatus Staskawiczbacteria bacterium RIFCSPHIGHO2_02_FULL_33_16]OGZ70967.1 MAG: hypothetical protein A2980_03095 [Candidatus Staskawiczbacteria bacterium RIFCSPLOWO2_01_FULL_33_13]
MEINKPITSIILIVIIAILIFLFVLPKYQESRALQITLVEKQAEYNGKSVYYAKISDLLLGIENRKDELEKINSSLPPDLFISPLIYFFEKKGSENGLIVKSIVFSELSPISLEKNSSLNTKKGVRNITFTIDILGNYQGLKNFLYSLERSSRLFQVNTISFASTESLGSKKSSQLPAYNFKLEVTTHSY